MRIVHISDIHWKGIQRHNEYTRAFEKLFTELVKIKPDIIVNTGDTFHTKTQGITPEVIERLSWMFRNLADIAPTYTLLGNHDGNLKNLNRQDIITPIHESIRHPRAHLLRKSGMYKVECSGNGDTDTEFYLGALSPFDKKGWEKVRPVRPSKDSNLKTVNIALYHGSIAGSEMDNNWRLPAEISEAIVSEFTEFDFVLLGDIHKHQWISRRHDKNGVSKPWMAYPGSLIQQNFGEDETKGFLIWDIRDKDDWDVKFQELENLCPFVTINWEGDVSKTIKSVERERQERAFLPGARFRISSSQNISSIEARKIIHELKEVRGASEVTFKYDLISKMEHFTANNLKISKKGLRQDPDAVVKLYLDYIATHAPNYKFNREQLDEAESLVRNYMARLSLRGTGNVATNVNWSIKYFEFDNLFRYGQNNKINFENLDGIVGIFGPNKTGKALDIKTPIPTPSGWKTMANVAVGDLVFDRNGAPCKVVAKSPIFTDHECYKITFSDGSTVIADAEHQWIVDDHKIQNDSDTKSKCKESETVERVVTTKQIYENKYFSCNGKKFNRWSIVACKPAEFPKKYAPIPPYVLGCWLAATKSNNYGFSYVASDTKISDRVAVYAKDNKVKTEIVGASQKFFCEVENLHYGLKALGLDSKPTKQKHIPKNYLLTSVEERKQLLWGIMDMAGKYDENGYPAIDIYNNKVLAKQVSELAHSLGFITKFTTKKKALVRGRLQQTIFRIMFIGQGCELPIFSPEAAKLAPPGKNLQGLQTQTSNLKRRYVVSVHPVEPRPVQCIVVDSKDHSFLFGKNYIPTHNSSIVGALMYTLFNTTDRGPMKNAYIINRNKNFGRGRIHINVGSDEYIIERQSARVIPKRKPKKHDSDKTTTTLNLYKVVCNPDSETPILKESNSISRDETDKVIRKKIGTANDFLLTALSSQGGVDAFIKEGPTERKNILSRFLELDIFKQLEELVKKDYNAMVARSKSLSPESLVTQIKNVRKEILTLQNAITQLDDTIQKQHSQRDEVGLWLMHHEKSAAEVDMKQINETEKLIKEAKAKLNSEKEALKNARKEISEFRKQLKNIKSEKKKIDVERLREQLEDLDAVRSTLHELKHELVTQESKLLSQKKNVRKLDLVPCGEEYPECYYIKDAHADKKRIEKQESIVLSLSGQLEAHQAKLKQYVNERISENIKRWEQLDREEFDLLSKLESSDKQSDFLKREIETTTSNLKSLKSKLDSLQKRVNVLESREYQKKLEHLSRIKNKINKLEKERHEKLVSLGGKKERLNGLLLEQEETRSLIEKLKIYDSIQNAFSKTGIPAMVLSSQMPAINLELNKILAGIVDFKITLETDVKSNVMDVYIEDAHSRRIIELASGMEKTIASMALRVALINLSSLPKPDILIIDEGFGALDEENTESCMEMLTFLRSYFKTILIISHVPQIKEIADKIIEIKNEDGESTVHVV